MLDELNTYLPIAERCFNALSTKASKSTLWSVIYCYFVNPDVWKCLNKNGYCSNAVAFRVFTNINSLTTKLFKFFKSSTSAIKSNYSTFCCTLLAATLCSVNSCCSFVMFNELEQWRHCTMLMLFSFIYFCCWVAQSSMFDDAKYISGGAQSTTTRL